MSAKVHPAPPIRGEWLHRRETQRVFAALADAGHLARAVGGAVRNELMGEPVVDIDIAVNADPDAVIRAATAAGLAVVPTGIKHGTVTVLVDHHPYEVTTLREDVETFGRHATVAFTTDWAADARRRDFTINALYCDADGQVFDPLGGWPDLLARRVRFIGNAGDRIREDYLRILRFFRFSARYGIGDLDAEGLHACVRERDGLARLSAERVGAEMRKLLVAARAAEALSAMFEHGLLSLVLGVAPNMARFGRLAAIERANGVTPHPMLRLAALAVHVEDDVSRLTERLRLSGHEREQLFDHVPRRLRPLADADDATVARLVHLWGRNGYRDALIVAWAEAVRAPDDARLRDRLAWAATAPERHFPLGGRDVLARGISPGPRVGQILRALEEWWIAAGFPDDPAMLDRELDRMISDPPVD